MKTKNFISIFIILNLFFLVLPSVNAYFVKIAAIDGPSYENSGQYIPINPSTINFGGDVEIGDPSADFYNVNANTVYSITYSASGYVTNTDDIYFDAALPSCSGTVCNLVSNDYFYTDCVYDNYYADWTCMVTDVRNNQWNAFIYNKNDPNYGEIIRTLKTLYPTQQPPTPPPGPQQTPEPPIISDIPDVNINEDRSFNINLDNYVSDADNLDSELSWSVSGNTNVIVNIVNRVAYISLVANWFGSESLTFSVSDPDGNSDSDSVVVNAASVNDLPVVNILNPASGSSFEEDDSVTFTGSANDIEDGSLTGNSLVWSSSLDGNLGSGASLNINSLSVGSHIITLTATDSNNGVSAATISVIITEEASVSDEDNEEEQIHKVNIENINMDSDVNCGESANVIVGLRNKGDYNEDVYVSLANSELELNKKSGETRINKNKEREIQLSFEVPENAKGEYNIEAKVYYSGRNVYSNKILNVNCGAVSESKGVTNLINSEAEKNELIIIITWILGVIALLALIIYLITRIR